MWRKVTTDRDGSNERMGGHSDGTFSTELKRHCGDDAAESTDTSDGREAPSCVTTRDKVLRSRS
jgi:hypothetical protein